MVFDFKNFKPGTASSFFKGLTDAIVSEAADWWTKFKSDAQGLLKSIAEGVLQTKVSFAAGRISAAQAKSLARIHQLAFRNFVLSVQASVLSLADRIIKVVARAVGWAFFNLTGLNVAPQLVTA